MKTLKLISFILISVIAIMILNSTGLDAGAVSTASLGGLIAYERGIFESLRSNPLYEGKNIEASNLRIHSTLTNSTGVHKFDLRNRNTLAVNEVGLDYNDLFVATRLGIYLIVEDDDRLGAEILQSYPNDQVFSGSGLTLQDMEVIYSGGLEIKTNQTVNAERIPGYNFRFVPQTQKSSAIGHSQFNPMEQVYWLPTILNFDGGKNVDIKYSFNPLTSMKIASVTDGYTNKLVFMPFGYLIKNGAAVKK
jgi:hypothetical protein